MQSHENFDEQTDGGETRPPLGKIFDKISLSVSSSSCKLRILVVLFRLLHRHCNYQSRWAVSFEASVEPPHGFGRESKRESYLFNETSEEPEIGGNGLVYPVSLQIAWKFCGK